MRKALKFFLIPAALVAAAGAGVATTAAPAKADVGFGLYFGTPGYYGPYHYRPYRYHRPYHYRPYYRSYGNCYWDSYYGRVCY